MKCTLIAALGCAIAFTSFMPVAQADKILFVTEDYPPSNYLDENGEIVGFGTEQVKLIMEKIGVDYDIELHQWSRSYNMAQTRDNTCVYATTHIPSRTELFQWVEPIGSASVIVTRLKSSDIQIASLDDLKSYKIGGVMDDVGSKTLEDKGFKINKAPRLELAIKKLKHGQIDLVAMSDTVLDKYPDVETAYTVFTQNDAIACNKDMSAETIAKMQQALDELIADGTQKALQDKYK